MNKFINKHLLGSSNDCVSSLSLLGNDVSVLNSTVQMMGTTVHLCAFHAQTEEDRDAMKLFSEFIPVSC